MKTSKLRRNNKNLKKSNNRLRKKLYLSYSENEEALYKVRALEQLTTSLKYKHRELNRKNKIFKYSLGAIILSKVAIFIFKDVI